MRELSKLLHLGVKKVSMISTNLRILASRAAIYRVMTETQPRYTVQQYVEFLPRKGSTHHNGPWRQHAIVRMGDPSDNIFDIVLPMHARRALSGSHLRTTKDFFYREFLGGLLRRPS